MRSTGAVGKGQGSMSRQDPQDPQDNPEEIDLNEELAEDDPDLQEPQDNPEEIDLEDG